MATLINNGLSNALFHAIKRWREGYKRSGYLSTTSCLASPRQRLLESRHDDAIVIQATTLFDAFIGTAIHTACEGADPLAIYEQEFTTNIAGIIFSGRPDVIHRENDVVNLGDFKTTKVSSYLLNKGEVKPEHQWQASINTWLARLDGYEVARAWVEYIFVDWNRNNRDSGYPPRCTRLYPTIATEAETHAFVTGRVLAHLAAEKLSDNDLPLCTPEEQWARNVQWAVYETQKSKRAKKLCPSEDAAKAYAKEEGIGRAGRIEHRSGVRVKCESFCHAKPFCSQYAQESECGA